MRGHNFRIVAWVAALTAGLAPAAWGVEAPAAADTYINTASGGSNYGTAVNLSVSSANTALVRFDLSGLPGGLAGANILRATLVMYANRVGYSGVLDIAPVESAWAENTVNAAASPAIGAAPVAIVVTGQSNSYLLADVTPLVRSWVDGSPNNGIAIRVSLQGPPQTVVLLDSKENLQTSHAAYLDITVGNTGAAGPPGVTGPVGAAGSAGAAGPAGSAGAAGPVGPTGSTGPAGATGAAGAQGAQGPQGTTGPQGSTGPVGPIGPTGAPGGVGLTGPAGATGPDGSAGARGATGNTGAQGLKGPAGGIGPGGPAGPAGVLGNGFGISTYASGATIPDSNRNQFCIVTVVAGGATASVTLPHANVKGQILYIVASDYGSGTTPRINVYAQGTDLIYRDSADWDYTGHTSFELWWAYQGFISDGAGSWLWI